MTTCEARVLFVLPSRRPSHPSVHSERSSFCFVHKSLPRTAGRQAGNIVAIQDKQVVSWVVVGVWWLFRAPNSNPSPSTSLSLTIYLESIAVNVNVVISMKWKFRMSVSSSAHQLSSACLAHLRSPRTVAHELPHFGSLRISCSAPTSGDRALSSFR